MSAILFHIVLPIAYILGGIAGAVVTARAMLHDPDVERPLSFLDFGAIAYLALCAGIVWPILGTFYALWRAIAKVKR